MPDPPPVGLLTRYLFENPWPPAIMLAAVGAGMLWVGLREGRRGLLGLGGGLLALGAVAIMVGQLVTTAGEHGEIVARELVDAAVGADVERGLAQFAPDATLSVGSTRNPGYGLDFIQGRFEQLAGRYRISSNRITSLRGYALSSDAAEVHLACSTVVGSSAPTPSQWVLRVERQPDGEWRITRLTAISIAMRTPSDRLW